MHEREMKTVSKLKKALVAKSLDSENFQTFSLPSLNNQDHIRLKSLEKIENENFDSHKKLKLKQKLQKIIPNEEDNNSVARCSARFLTKHVKSLNRINNDYSMTESKSPFFRKNSSICSNKGKSTCRATKKEEPKGSASITVYENSTSKHKNKLMKVLSPNMSESVQDFIKRVENSNPTITSPLESKKHVKKPHRSRQSTLLAHLFLYRPLWYPFQDFKVHKIIQNHPKDH